MEPRGGWLDETEQRAWQGLLAFAMLALPELERAQRRHGLVHIEYGLLAALTERPFRLSDLASMLNMSQSRLSHRMNKLRDRGLVTVRPCLEDGRVTIAEITPSGRSLVEKIAPEHVEDVRRLVFDSLNPDQTHALADALQAVMSGLRMCSPD
ncbi:MarR family transcriptional regulator [Acrocarpospora macrocephala]|uniref:Transcriptional regulator n=1 Tax=Acrocarpospora macrocephala TaxID=150177 RepID=A0A5M3WKQ0_9ACTN|nr:MarR family transcriptional regulator [Acrocarpospora macrocephala]GES09825.1 transcriptional regulator [Acrocarpospora macrocephala]